MVFNSIEFLFFFPIVCLLYFILPTKIRYVGLLLISYYFCMCWGSKFVGWLILSTLITYICGRFIEVIKFNKKAEKIKAEQYAKICLFVGIILNLSMLFCFKYLEFFGKTMEWILSRVNVVISVSDFHLLLPIGMSFYVFQGIGYIIDVYRGDIGAEKNFLKYALFLAFFPRLISGPIERSNNLLKQIEQPTRFEVENVRRGLLVFAWGLFLKLVIADRIANIINPIFDNYQEYHAMSYLIIVIMYAFQVYFDFEGYTLMAIGCAGVLGYQLKENFAAPYFSLSIQEFWRRWHISLTSWFRDYLYIPLGGNRKGKTRKHMNTMIVFLASGLWHGAGWNYIIWGGLNGFYIVCQELTKQFREFVYKRLKIDTNHLIFKWTAGILTFLLIDFSWLFFRVETFGKVVDMLTGIFVEFELTKLLEVTFWGSFITAEGLVFLVILILIALAVDYMKYKNVDVPAVVFKQRAVIRWALYYVILFVIIFAGAYGEGYEQTQFIYFQF